MAAPALPQPALRLRVLLPRRDPHRPRAGRGDGVGVRLAMGMDRFFLHLERRLLEARPASVHRRRRVNNLLVSCRLVAVFAGKSPLEAPVSRTAKKRIRERSFSI